MKHVHHKIPKSRGGTNDLSNLEELDFIEHARIHAEDFLKGGPRFDFRHDGWPYLDQNLREQVLKKASEHSRGIIGFGGDVSTFDQKSAAGKKGGPIGAKNQPREVRVQNAKKGVQTRIKKYGTPFVNKFDLNTQFRCPCCGYIGNAGNVTQHLNAKSNDCVGAKQPL